MTFTQSTQLHPQDNQRLLQLCGECDTNLRYIEKTMNVTIHNRAYDFEISGAQQSVQASLTLIEQLYALTTQPVHLTHHDIYLQIQTITHIPDTETPSIIIQTPCCTITPCNPSQLFYLKQLQTYDINFGIGASGTGKTYLAVASAVAALEAGDVKRIILTRPALEAGERLGFLPGDLSEKLDPYLKPLYDALQTMLPATHRNHLMQEDLIEIAPLAYMRGRTLNDAFIILDEGQNTTPEQMKMFLTRIGFNSKAVITGDISQTDLPHTQASGLKQAIDILSAVEGIGHTWFQSNDVIRHPLVKKVIEAYQLHSNPH
tara:strand:+ start:2727 stop:3677 length:951 start_codon:yes stop_codon:yes gene_type:complete